MKSKKILNGSRKPEVKSEPSTTIAELYQIGGMHLTPVHATSGVLGLVHAHA